MSKYSLYIGYNGDGVEKAWELDTNFPFGLTEQEFTSLFRTLVEQANIWARSRNLVTLDSKSKVPSEVPIYDA